MSRYALARLDERGRPVLPAAASRRFEYLEDAVAEAFARTEQGRPSAVVDRSTSRIIATATEQIRMGEVVERAVPKGRKRKASGSGNAPYPWPLPF